MVILGWVSQERAYKLKLRMDRGPELDDPDKPVFEPTPKGPKPTVGKVFRRELEDAEVPEGLPDQFFDEEGYVNLSRVKLKDAIKYMNTIGIKMPMPLPNMNRGSTRIVNKEKLPTMDDLFNDK